MFGREDTENNVLKETERQETTEIKTREYKSDQINQ